jgi:hypothetical protein
VPRLDAIGVTETDLDNLRTSRDRLRNGDGQTNAARVEAEYRQILRQLEQLEVQIGNNASVDSVEYETSLRQGETTESAADYFRRLSEQPLRLKR